MMNKFRLIIFLAFVLSLFSCNKKNVPQQKLTGINTLSYTDVIYFATKDTALVSTYSGRISMVVNNEKEEHVIAQINDEIYSLEFFKKRNEIIASTMSSGILILDGSSGKIKKSLATGQSWINNISLSTNGKFLFGYNGARQNFIWDVSKDYEIIEYPKDFPESLVRFGKGNNLYHSGKKKLINWNPITNQILTQKLPAGLLVDVDSDGNTLLINYDEFVLFREDDSINSYSKKHPDWPFYYAAKDTIYRIPYQMKLTAALLTENKICTGGIDSSIRIWDIVTGDLKGEFNNHKATISGVKLSNDGKQIVSVDLKGGIYFSELSKFKSQ